MVLRRQRDGYFGSIGWRGDGNWTVTFGQQGGGTFTPITTRNLFDAETLLRKLREVGAQVLAVAFDGDRCLITPVKFEGRVYPHGQAIKRAMVRVCPTYLNNPIKWDWYIPQRD